MLKTLRAILRRLVPVRLLAPLLLFGRGTRSGMMRGHGWARTLRTKLPLDENDQAIPWIPYVAVDFLAERLTQAMSVLELGAGYSTLFFMARVDRVVSIEHDRAWIEWVRARADARVTLMESNPGSAAAYLEPLRAVTAPFDLVLVDGIHRNEAFSAALGHLTPGGVILLDDSHRAAYAPAFAAAADAGFRHLHLEGHKAASLNLYRTTVFYRDGNCLGI